MARHARERIPPARYLASRLLREVAPGLETLLAERGLVTRDELVTGRPRGRSSPGRVLKASTSAGCSSRAARRDSRSGVPPPVQAGRPRRGEERQSRRPHTAPALRAWEAGESSIADYGVFIFPMPTRWAREEAPAPLPASRFAHGSCGAPTPHRANAVYVRSLGRSPGSRVRSGARRDDARSRRPAALRATRRAPSSGPRGRLRPFAMAVTLAGARPLHVEGVAIVSWPTRWRRPGWRR